MTFFLEGVLEIATQSTQSASRIIAIFADDRARIAGAGRQSSTILRVHEVLQANPIISIAKLSKETGLTIPPIARAVDTLSAMGIIREITGRQRDRLFQYDAYLSVLSEGAEPL